MIVHCSDYITAVLPSEKLNKDADFFLGVFWPAFIHVWLFLIECHTLCVKE